VLQGVHIIRKGDKPVVVLLDVLMCIKESEINRVRDSPSLKKAYHITKAIALIM
jgi:hypothetical protein